LHARPSFVSTTDRHTGCRAGGTRPQAGVYGIAGHIGTLATAYDLYTGSGGLYAAMFGAPNQWREAGGKFTRTWETDEFKAGLGFTRDLEVHDPQDLLDAVGACLPGGTDRQ
jgi:hypothetical protein